MTIQSMQRSMGFVSPAARSTVCGCCARLERRGDDLRCSRGGFYVRANSACDEHVPVPASTQADTKIQIGPTDV